MNIEHYIPWNPFEEAVQKFKNYVGGFQITHFENSFEGISIHAEKRWCEQPTKFHIKFPLHGTIATFINESYTTRLNSFFLKQIEKQGDYGFLFIVENSEYMKFISNESYGYTDILCFRHYHITDFEWIIDVASEWKPQIELFVDGVLKGKLDYKNHYFEQQKKEEAEAKKID